MFTTLSYSETVLIRNKRWPITDLCANYSNEVHAFVNAYMEDKNCWPDTFINNENLSEIEKAAFIYHCNCKLLKYFTK